MTFSVSAKPTPEELSEAVNYLLSNFSQTMAINPNTGRISTASYGVVSYLYKYLQVKYADSYNGQVNFSNVPTNRLYYGIRNNDSPTESTNPADYQWLPVTGGFGTSIFFWYATTGGRQIETFIGPVRPSVNFVKDTGNAIDLDLLTIAAEDKTDPPSIDYSLQIQALEQTIGSIPQPQLGTMSPQNAENVAITGGNINNVNLSQATVVDYENFSSVAAPSYAIGRTWYDSTQNTLAYYNDVTNNLVHIGQETQVKVINNTGSTIAIGSPVYITSTSSGFSYPNVALAKADAASTSAVLGLTTQAIPSGASGYVTTSGIIQPCNTGTFSVGTVVYLSPYSAGQLMGTIPPTGYPIQVGVVAYSNTPNGAIYVKQTTPLAVAASSLTGQVAIANGGTNGTATPTAGAVPYGTGTAYAFSAAGTSGQVLTSQGSGAPTWTTPTTGTVTSVTGTSPVVSSGGTTPAISLATAYGDTLNPYASKTANYVLAAPNGSSGAPTFRALVASDIPTLSYVTSVTGTAPVVSSGGTTPAISMAAATASANGYLTSTDWTTFNNKQPAGAYLTSVTSDAPLTGAGTSASHLSIPPATTSVSGYLTSTDWNTFNNKQAAGTYVTSVSVVSANGFAGTVTTGATPAITLTTSITGLLKGNGTAISAAVANTDYVPLSTVLTNTADYTITGTDTWIINNKSGSALTLTFPAASSWTGRSITVKNMQPQLVNSASSNIVPIDSTTAGTAILLGVVGNWATMVSDGTNWVIMQAASNNNLLLE
jgi:hypothetical protein